MFWRKRPGGRLRYEKSDVQTVINQKFPPFYTSLYNILKYAGKILMFSSFPQSFRVLTRTNISPYRAFSVYGLILIKIIIQNIYFTIRTRLDILLLNNFFLFKYFYFAPFGGPTRILFMTTRPA